jgi:hypothetical protein
VIRHWGTLLLLGYAGSAGAQPSSDSSGLPPAGFGTLRQDEIAVLFEVGSIQVRLLPLDPRVVRLLASDTDRSLTELVLTRAEEIERAARQHGLRRFHLFLVTFFGLQPRAQFDPEGITLTSENRLFRPAAIVPLSAQWSQLELNQRETASAIYLFEDGITLLEPIAVSYGGLSTDQWGQSLRLIEAERARVFARAASSAGAGTPK